MKAYMPARLVGALVQALYDRPPVLEKRPGPPDGFA